MSKPSITIIGPGNVGGALGNRLVSAGYPVTFGVRDEGSIESARAKVSASAQVRLTKEAVQGADIVFLAVPGGVAVEAASALGSLEGKILVDCNNPVRWESGPVWDPPDEGSIAQAIQARLPGARVVKAFNTFGAEFHANPDFGGRAVDVQIAADDDAARLAVAEVAEAAGFRPVQVGPLRNAALVENLAVLWIHLAMVEKRGRDSAFVLLDRDS